MCPSEQRERGSARALSLVGCGPPALVIEMSRQPRTIRKPSCVGSFEPFRRAVPLRGTAYSTRCCGCCGQDKCTLQKRNVTTGAREISGCSEKKGTCGGIPGNTEFLHQSTTHRTSGLNRARCSENHRPTQTSCVVAGMVLAVCRGSENHRPTQTSCVVAGMVLAVCRCSENHRPTQTS